MEPRILPHYRMPPETVKTSNEDLELAGRQGNLEKLRNKSLGYRELGRDVTAMVFPKLKPYAPGPGMDHMIFVAKKNGYVRSLRDLSSEQGGEVLDMADVLMREYEDMATPDNPIVRRVIAINFHQNPLEESALGKKLHAQTLADLHVHVVAFREQDRESTKEAKPGTLTKQERYDVQDPMMRVVELLAQEPAIRERLSQGLNVLKLKDSSEFEGLNFNAPTGTDHKILMQDLATLHRNVGAVYQEIVSMFVDLEKLDASGMPSLRPSAERLANVKKFMGLLHQGKEEIGRGPLEKFLSRLSAIMRSGQSLKSLSPQQIAETPVFLRNYAYTMSLVQDRGSDEMTVNMAPRILSTGNMLSSLGLHKLAQGLPSSEYLAQRTAAEQRISERLSEMTMAA